MILRSWFYFLFVVSIATKHEERQQNDLRGQCSHIQGNHKQRVLI